MSKHRAIITQYPDEYGHIIIDGGQVYIATSSTPQLFSVDVDEEFINNFYSKFIIEPGKKKLGEKDIYFNWKKHVPKEWNLVDIEIRVVTNIDFSSSGASEEWEDLGCEIADFIKLQIERDNTKPYQTKVSLNTWEKRYKLNDDTFRFFGGFGSANYEIQKLKKVE